MKTIHLQGIGEVKAKPAKELKIGDKTFWNCDQIEVICNISNETQHSRVYTIISEKSGLFHTRRLRNTRLVGVVQ